MKIAEHLGVEIPRATPDEAVQRAFQEKGRDISSRVREIGGTGLSAEVRKALAEAYAVGFARWTRRTSRSAKQHRHLFR